MPVEYRSVILLFEWERSVGKRGELTFGDAEFTRISAPVGVTVLTFGSKATSTRFPGFIVHRALSMLSDLVRTLDARLGLVKNLDGLVFCNCTVVLSACGILPPPWSIITGSGNGGDVRGREGSGVKLMLVFSSEVG